MASKETKVKGSGSVESPTKDTKEVEKVAVEKKNKESPRKKQHQVAEKKLTSSPRPTSGSTPTDDTETEEKKDKVGPSTTTTTTDEPGVATSGDVKPDETAADDGEKLEEGAGGSWSGWFTNTLSETLNIAKGHSSEMFEYLKKDVSEFSESVQEVGRDLKDKLKLEDTAKSASEKIGKNFNYMLDQMSTIFGVAPDDDDDDERLVCGPGGLPINRIEAKIYALAMDESVFLNDPDDIERYEMWMANFDLESKNKEMTDMLTANPHLQLQYSQLVPDKVTHLVFWHRFYYQVHLICEAEARSKASKTKVEPSERSELDVSQDIVDISEEDTKKLLAEYEEEMKKKDEPGHSRGSSGTQLSSSSSGSFAFVTHDGDDVRVE